MADEFIRLGIKLVTGGTDNHMILIDLSDTSVTGKQLQEYLDEDGYSTNKNMIPGDRRNPQETSGLRLGTPAMTTKGYTEQEFKNIANDIAFFIQHLDAKNRNS